MKPTLFAFDLDGTLCDSGQRVLPEIRRLLRDVDAILVSGAAYEKIGHQAGPGHVTLAQNGNDARLRNGVSLWFNALTAWERHLIFRHIENFGGDVQDRGCQVSVSLVGHEADPALKRAYDPGGSKRRALLERFPVPAGIEARIGGTTCLDYTRAGCNKGSNLKRLMEKHYPGYSVTYFGDQLFPGGNDESVIGVCETVQVSGPADTLAKLTDRMQMAAA